MLTSYAVGVLAIVALATGWVAVQRAWRRSFPDAFDDPDVLAGRSGGCGGCGCGPVCQRRAERSDPNRATDTMQRGDAAPNSTSEETS